MSGALNTLTQTVSAYFKTSRSIGAIIPDCAVEERHTDSLTVTQHPVERGAFVNDHFYRMPAEVILRWAWSNSSPQNALSGGLLGIAASAVGLPIGKEKYAREKYDALLALQRSGLPFTLVTGKRSYRSMLMTSLSVETTEATEYGLHVEAVCTEVIIVSTKSTNVAPNAAQANPQQTGAVDSVGQQQAAPAAFQAEVTKGVPNVQPPLPF